MSTIINSNGNSASNIINSDNYVTDILPLTTNAYNLGSSSLKWKNGFFTGTVQTGNLAATATSNQLVLGTTTTTTISAAAPASSHTMTIPDSRMNCNIIAQSINSGLTNASNRPAVSGGTSLAGAYEIRSFSNNGLSQDDGFIRLRSGGGTNGNSAAYIDISGYSAVPDMDNNIVLGTLGTEQVRINNSGQVLLKATSSQLVLGTTNTITINSTAPSAPRTYTLPDAGGNANIILSTGNQTINSQLTLSNTGQTSHFTGFQIANVNSWDNIWIQENSGTGKRAGIKFGGTNSNQGWEIIQDSANNGTRNFVIVNDNAGNNAVVINTDSSATLTGPITITNGPCHLPSVVLTTPTINTATTLDDTYSGQIIALQSNSTNYTITLPTVASVGVRYSFSISNTGGAGNITIASATTNGLNAVAIQGTTISYNYAKTSCLLTTASLTVGDRIEVYCDSVSWVATFITKNSALTFS